MAKQKKFDINSFDVKSRCPICKFNFQDCKHSFSDLDHVMNERYLNSLIEKKIKEMKSKGLI